MQATPQVIPFVPLTQAIPAVEAVTQTELRLLLSLRGRLCQLQGQLEIEEQSIQARLEASATIEQATIPRGSKSASGATWPGRK